MLSWTILLYVRCSSGSAEVQGLVSQKRKNVVYVLVKKVEGVEEQQRLFIVKESTEISWIAAVENLGIWKSSEERITCESLTKPMLKFLHSTFRMPEWIKLTKNKLKPTSFISKRPESLSVFRGVCTKFTAYWSFLRKDNVFKSYALMEYAKLGKNHAKSSISQPCLRLWNIWRKSSNWWKKKAAKEVNSFSSNATWFSASFVLLVLVFWGRDFVEISRANTNPITPQENIGHATISQIQDLLALFLNEIQN